jgi:predicted O-methyltransferase YrrM
MILERPWGRGWWSGPTSLQRQWDRLKVSTLLIVTTYNLSVTTIALRRRVLKMRHRTPRYVCCRIRQKLVELAHPDEPWITPEATRLLETMIRPSDTGAEFGSGRSTLWFARRCRFLTSVEFDEQWYAKISAALRSQGLVNVDYKRAPKDQPKETGDQSAYARVALSFDDESIDFVLVDGLYRDYVARFMLPKLKRGGLLIIDNVNWYLPSRTRSPCSRGPEDGCNGPVWTELAPELAQWRMIWTSSGVSDTAIFIKS